MIVSKLDWQYNYWIDLSDRWAEVFSITMEEFQKIQSWQAMMVDDEVVDVPTPEVVEIETTEPTQEELLELKVKEAEQLIVRKLALETIGEDTVEVQEKIDAL